MEFGSVAFLLRFLPIFLISYYVVPGRMKNFILFLGSLCFYASGTPFYLFLMLAVGTSDYLHGLLIERYRRKKASRLLLGNAILIDSLILLFFGYADFLIEAVNYLAGTNIRPMGLPIPLGLTIFTYQAMSYLIDLYRGRVKVRNNYFDYLVYLSMFPQLPGGPIVQYGEIESRLHNRRLELHQVSRGLQRFCLGLAKKVLLADLIAELWGKISVLGPDTLSLGTAWLGITAFGFQMYYSLSGYADMAIGLSYCLGFEYPENFRHPFAATSVKEFTETWNMSLMKWMRDYIYDPLVGKEGGAVKRLFAVLLIWALIGLWYGPDGTFLLWGIWMAVFYLLEKLFWNKIQKHLPGVVNWLLTMLVVFAGLVLFALNDFESVWAYCIAMAGLGRGGLLDHGFWYLMIEYFPYMAIGCLFAIPHFSALIEKMRTSRNVLFVAVYRLLEKVVPSVLLILSLVKVAGC